jgi:hypothetical protein
MVTLTQAAPPGAAALPNGFVPITEKEAVRLLAERMGATAIPGGLRWYQKTGATADEMRCLPLCIPSVGRAMTYFLGGYAREQAVGLVAVRP